jgi:hypothetical protein
VISRNAAQALRSVSDGVLETMMTNCSDDRVAVLVTSGNPTFRTNNARRRLLERIHALEAQLQEIAQRSQ